MKGLGLILLACLLLALRVVAQAPEKAAPDDLVVTAEVVGYSKRIVYPNDLGNPVSKRKLRQYLKQPSKKYNYVLQAKMVVRNTTSHPREINFMICDWPRSWIARGENGFYEPTFIPGCDKNYPAAITIPAGEAVVFRCPLYEFNAFAESIESYDGLSPIKLGFVDFKLKDFGDIDNYRRMLLAEGAQAEKLASWIVYWSNTIINKIDLNKAKEFTGYEFPWGVTWNDEYWPTWRDE